VVDSSHVRAKGGREDRPKPSRSPPAGLQAPCDRDGRGTPLAATLTAANRNDITEMIPLVDRIPPTGRHGKFRPKALLADRAYDSQRHRKALRERGITPRIAKRNTAHGSAKNAGWSSARFPGCTNTAASSAATIAAPTSTKHSSRSAAP
jgi:IS5 family transposase